MNDSVKLLLLIFLGVIILMAIPALICYFLYKWLSRKGYKKIALLIVTGICAFIFYSIYTAFYPLDSFYKDEFTAGIHMKFPDDAIILAKDASYPDFHGKYCSCSLIKMNNSDYNKTINLLRKSNLYILSNSNDFFTEELSNVIAHANKLDTAKATYFQTKFEDSKNFVDVGFLNNKKNIIFQRCNFK